MPSSLDWEKLRFEYIPTACYVRSTFKNGKWGKIKVISKNTINLSIAATCLHYGQACFEGLKVFIRKDGRLCAFRPDENLKRMNKSAELLCCPQIPDELFYDALKKVVKGNLEYIPPYGSGGSLYIRPLLIGSGPTIGVAPSSQYEFIILVIPVGAYYKGGMQAVDSVIFDDYDRAAPNGMGHIKAGGNYAAGLYPGMLAKKMNCQVVLYLNAREKTFIEEFGTSNFIGITKGGAYLTPDSKSILPSVTNKSLEIIASDMGIKVERRPIRLEELSDFAEVGACGTAVIITPIKSIRYNNKIWEYPHCNNGVLRKLYDALQGIQFGVSPDKFNWLMEIL
jgi:branched-chain amino acid aminotransferase